MEGEWTGDLGWKVLQVRIPSGLYEEFFRAFPGRGERRMLVEQFIEVAIELAPEKHLFLERVFCEIRRRSEGKEEWDG
jgi:hypothetical protein